MGIREIAELYSMTYDKFGITGTHGYWEGTNVTDDGSGANRNDGGLSGGVTPMGGSTPSGIPVIGDIFTDAAGTPFPNMFCINVSQKVIANDARVIQYLCTYSNEPIDNRNMLLPSSAPTTIESLPQNWTYGGEMILFKINEKFITEGNWKWPADSAYHPNEKIANAIPMRVRTWNRKIQRIVAEDKYVDFCRILNNSIGKVNNAEWQGGGENCILFVGADEEIMRDQQNKLCHRFELNFSYRDPDGLNIFGWQKILTEIGTWATPVKTDNTYLYDNCSFDLLFQ